MNTKKSPFQWVDRDTAGYDLLQVVYHAPHSVSLTALELLSSIRSTAIINDLQAIALNEEWDDWSRVYAIRAIASTGLDQEFLNLKPLVTRQLQIIEHHWRTERNSSEPSSYLSSGILDAIFGLVDKCPANHNWFFEIIDNFDNNQIKIRILGNFLNFEREGNMANVIKQRLSQLILKNKDHVTLSSISGWIRDGELRNALNSQVDRIAESLDKYYLKYHFWIYDIWDELYQAVKKYHPEVEQLVEESQRQHQRYHSELQPRKQQPLNLDDFPIYQQLKQLYDDARSGNKRAYGDLVSVARWYRGEIPIRAVALHFVCGLQDQYDSMGMLKALFAHSRDKWGEIDDPLSPIRVEVGSFLYTVPSPDVWVAFIEAYFNDVPNQLAYHLSDWITDVTDFISGDKMPSSDKYVIGNVIYRSWFKALANYDDDILDVMVKP